MSSVLGLLVSRSIARQSKCSVWRLEGEWWLRNVAEGRTESVSGHSRRMAAAIRRHPVRRRTDPPSCVPEASQPWPRRRRSAPRVNLHELRHTNITAALRAGIPVHVISRRVGHSKVSTTLDTYARHIPSADDMAAETIGRLLSDPVEWAHSGHTEPDSGTEQALTVDNQSNG